MPSYMANHMANTGIENAKREAVGGLADLDQIFY